MRLLPIVMLCLVAVIPAHAHACWEEAGREKNISPQLLYAIGEVESSLNPSAKNTSHYKRTKSYGIGIMQIESVHLPRLKRQNIDEARLLSDPCTNIKVGADILADQFKVFGVTWEAVGAYNASCTVLKGDDCRRARANYAWKVYRRMQGASLRNPRAGRQQPHRSRPAQAPASQATPQVVIIQERLS